jgi:hypothetical protein
MTSMVARRMAEAAATLIESWDQAQRRIACRPFPDEAERRLWYYTPTDHGGLPLAAMGPVQHRNVHRLVATGLSTPGYVTVALIMGLDNILDQLEGWSVDFGRERGRDPLLYYITIFGAPGGDAPWGWRFGGHHVSLHYTIIGGQVAASTPNFLGADPAVSPLLGPHLHRPLAAAEDLGRELFWSRRGGGAHRDHAPIRVSGATDPQRAVVGSTYTFKMRIEAYVALVEGILRAGADHRRMGSTALMMCHVADGRLDGCVTGYCNSWDVIGGLFLVQEAGGVASDFIAENGLLEPGSALACTPGLQQILEQVRGRSAR